MVFRMKVICRVVGITMLLTLGFMTSVAQADGYVKQANSVTGYYITSKSQWEKVKLEVKLPPDIQSLAPNFAQEALILATWGEKPTAGYSLDIIDLKVEGSEAVVTLALQYPEKGSFTAQVLTYPAAARQVDVKEMTQVEKVVFKDLQGQVLDEVKVTPPETYTVKLGDTLWKIARNLGRTQPGEIMDFVHQVIVWNGLASANDLVPGEKLLVPGALTGAASRPFKNLDWWALEQNLITTIKEEVGKATGGFVLNGESLQASGRGSLVVQEASPRSTGLWRAQVKLDAQGAVSLDETTPIALYTATGPWIKDTVGNTLADVRDVEGASVVNFLSLAPDGKSLAIGVRGYQNLLLLWDTKEGTFSEVKRYSDELVSRIVWSPDSRFFTVELAGAWGRYRLENFTSQGEPVDWPLEEHWSAGYNLHNPRWLGTRPVLSFSVKTVGLEATTSDLVGDWLFDPAEERLYPAGSEAAPL